MIIYVFIGLLAIFSIMIVISHIVLGNFLIRHKDDWNIWEHEDIYTSIPHGVDEYLEHGVYRAHKEAIYKAGKWIFEMKPELVEITDEKDVKLRGHLIINPESKGFIIMAHGYRSNAVYEFGPVAEWLYNQNYSLLMIDQRAQNMSEGKAMTLGVKESMDILEWTEYLEAHYPDFPVILMGASLGGTAVLMATEERMCSNTVGIVADSAYTSPKTIINYFMRKKIGALSVPIIWAADAVSREKCDFRFNDRDTRKALTHNSLPLLLFHGKADKIVPYSMSEENYAIASKKVETELILIENAGHAQCFVTESEIYKEKLLAFLEKAEEWE